LFNNNENPSNTQGKNGALNTNNPIKFNLINGFLRDHIYTKVNASEYPRNGTLDSGDKIYTIKKINK
jgi:hypothetical protein